MSSIKKCGRLLAVLVLGLWLAVPALADDGDGALCSFVPPFPCPVLVESNSDALEFRDYSRPGSVIVFPEFIRGGGAIAICGAGNVLVNGECLPRTEIELGATCPTRFTTGDQSAITHPKFACVDHEPVRVRFRWVCPGTERNPTCKATGFDVLLSLDGKVVFTANGFALPDANQVPVPAAPCERGYLIGWVIDEFGNPKKYDGLIGDAVIRNSGTATAIYRGITIQAYGAITPGNPIPVLQDPLGLEPPGLFFSGVDYRVVTGQVTGDVVFDTPAPAAGPGFGTSTSLILLTLDVRSDSPNFPTFVDLDIWNAAEQHLSTFVEFVCWGEFRLSTDINSNLTQAFMGSRTGIVQSGEAVKIATGSTSDIAGNTTLLGLVQTDEGPLDAPMARSRITEFYNNGIRFWTTAFFP